MEINFNERVYAIVARIPKGTVLTYGQIAFMAGSPRASRIVGAVMAKVPAYMDIPCQRVIYSNGSLCKNGAFGGEGIQRKLLEGEGVTFLPDGRVNLRKHLWDGD